MPDLLLELFSEEIPARMQGRAADDLRRLVTDGLVERGLTYAHAAAFATPRRLTLALEGLADHSPALREERKGPRTDAPAKAIEGFLRSVGAAPDKAAQFTQYLAAARGTDGVSIPGIRIEIRQEKKAEVFLASIERPGRPAAQIVAETVEAVVRAFPWPKSMRWGAGTLRWVRPLHSILCILTTEAGAEIVPFAIDGIAAGDRTRGHRFMAPDGFAVTSFEDYEAKLKRARVLLDPAERAEQIWHEATQLAFAQGLEVVEDKGLLAEVAGLVEWPVVLMGRIEDRFLALPPEVLRTSMREHQKFLSVRDPATGQIVAYIIVANRETADDGATILAGNAKVLAARLSDAVFFWENDLRTPLDEMVAKLDAVTFHNKLGTQGARIARIAALAREIAPLVGADPNLAERAATLAKADLASQMVYEFPELQGTMGKYYAERAGEDGAVARAAEQHYSPLGPSDFVPSEPIPFTVALADKIDVLSGFWAIDEKPTGSKDPFALRRTALGVVRTLLENKLRVSLSHILPRALIISAAMSKSDFGQHSDARGMLFLEDSFRHVMEGMRLHGASIPLLYKSPQFLELKRDISENFSWKEGTEGADRRLTAFIERISYLELFAVHEKSIIEGEDVEGKYPNSYKEHLTQMSEISQELTPISDDILVFLHDRLKVYLRDQGIRHDVIDACLAMPDNDDLTLLVARVRALNSFLATRDGANLLQGYKRANNILTAEEKKDGVEYSLPEPRLAETPAEGALFDALDEAEAALGPALAAEDFAAAMTTLATLREPIDAFFDTTVVNAPSQIVRRNRLCLLNRIRAVMNRVAIFSAVEG